MKADKLRRYEFEGLVWTWDNEDKFWRSGSRRLLSESSMDMYVDDGQAFIYGSSPEFDIAQVQLKQSIRNFRIALLVVACQLIVIALTIYQILGEGRK